MYKRRKILKQLTLIGSIFLFFSACSKLKPADIWINYKPNQLEEHVKDEGLFTGYKVWAWKSAQLHTFTTNSIVDFASKNGWKYVDGIRGNLDDINTIAPLKPFVQDPWIYQSLNYWRNKEATMYLFSTGRKLRIKDTDIYTSVDGLVIVDESETIMRAYHLWGE